MRAHLLTAALVLLSATTARADAILESIRAASQKAPMVAFERTTKAIVRANPKKDPALVVDRFVPKGSGQGQWTLVSIDGRTPSAAEVEKHRKANAKGPVPGFHRLHVVLGGTPAKRTEQGGRILYRFDGLPEGTMVTPGGDLSSRLSAEAVVDPNGGKPVVEKVRIFAADVISFGGVARMNALDVVSYYGPGNAGVPFLKTQTSISDVKAPFGMGGKRQSEISFRPL